MTSFIVRLGYHIKNCKQLFRWGAETLTGGSTGLFLLHHLAIDVRDYQTTTWSSDDICPPRHMVSLVHNEFKIDASRYPAKAGRLKIRIYIWFYLHYTRHYSDVTWEPYGVSTWLFIQQLLHANNKEKKIKATPYLLSDPLWGNLPMIDRFACKLPYRNK